VTLTNTGGATLQISNIATTGHFAISSKTCGNTLGAGASCQINVKFTAESPIAKFTGTLELTDNAPGSPQIVQLEGQVFPPCLMQNSSGSPTVLRTTPSVTFNISDTHPSCHTTTTTMSCINNLQATCVFNPPTISPGGSTVLTVQNLSALTTDDFTFTAQGTDKTNTTGVNLSLLLKDFTFTPFPTTASVTAGQTATYAIAVGPVNGLSGAIQLACQGAPSGSTCSVTPSMVTLEQGAPENVSVAVSTSSRAMGAPRGGAPLPGPGASLRLVLWASLLALLGLAAWMTAGSHLSRPLPPSLARGRLRLGAFVLAALALMLMAWAACGGGGVGNMGNGVSNAGTPAGTYTLNVTGTYESSTGQPTGLTHTQSLTLQVN
jgi:hypothetical protein